MAVVRRNDSGWRQQVLEARGERCRSCGTTRDVQVDHVVPRSQGGPSVVENGTPLCGPFGNGCHPAVTEKRLLIQPEWLDDDQIAWLEENGHVWWDEEGEVYGRLRRSFARKRKTSAYSEWWT